jgi:hypothetical protein
MWLHDANMPRKIAIVLGQFGISAQTAELRGWNGLANGMLVEVHSYAPVCSVSPLHAR